MLIENNFHYPVILKLTGKKCVIIGGGRCEITTTTGCVDISIK